MIARSACASARALGVRRLGQRAAERGDEEVVALLREREGAGLAGAADDAARRAGEADQVLGVAARGAGGQVRREAGGEQELEPERERVGARGPLGRAVEQRELVGEQVVDAGMRLAVAEQPRDGVARAGGAVQRAGVLAQPRVAGERLRARDRQQVAPGLRRGRGRGGRTAPGGRRSATWRAGRPWRSRSLFRAPGYRGAAPGRPRRSGCRAGRWPRSSGPRASAHYTK